AMRVETVNGKRYILVIIDDYSRYTHVYFPRTKDKTPKMVIKFITQIQRNMKVQVLKVRSDNENEFKNEKPRSYYEKLGIMHQTIARMPQQNGVVECRNRTLIEGIRTMLIFSKLPEFLWAKAISITCFTQNRSLVHISSLCYLTNDRDDLGKMRPKADIESSEELNETPSKEYYAMRTPEVSDNSAANTLDNEDTSSSSSIIIEDHDAPQIVSLSEEPIVNEPTTPVFDNHSDEQVQEDLSELDGNTSMNPFVTIKFEEAGSSSNDQDP
ncbi:retrovirus-related pol polyprotein from transposon TNT 1-94, partial [Tanacetum coccineum]